MKKLPKSCPSHHMLKWLRKSSVHKFDWKVSRDLREGGGGDRARHDRVKDMYQLVFNSHPPLPRPLICRIFVLVILDHWYVDWYGIFVIVFFYCVKLLGEARSKNKKTYCILYLIKSNEMQRILKNMAKRSSKSQKHLYLLWFLLNDVQRRFLQVESSMFRGITADLRSILWNFSKKIFKNTPYCLLHSLETDMIRFQTSFCLIPNDFRKKSHEKESN